MPNIHSINNSKEANSASCDAVFMSYDNFSSLDPSVTPTQSRSTAISTNPLAVDFNAYATSATESLPGHNAVPNGFDYSRILSILFNKMGPEIALQITRSLHRHYLSNMAQITDVRATMIYNFKPEWTPWPVVEWREGDNTDVVAIFKVEDDVSPCSYLMHCGVGSWQEDGRHWMESSLVSLVSNFEQLKELFQAGQHIFGILQWSNVDLLALYCEQAPRDGSEEE